MERKIIEVVEGYASRGETGHIQPDSRFGLPVWAMPTIYKKSPNIDNFRKVKITYEEIKETNDNNP